MEKERLIMVQQDDGQKELDELKRLRDSKERVRFGYLEEIAQYAHGRIGSVTVHFIVHDVSARITGNTKRTEVFSENLVTVTDIEVMRKEKV